MADYGFIAQAAGPLDQLGKLATVQNQVNQNLLFQGRQAAGQALQQSIDPQTGQIDFNNVNRLIQSNPKIAPYAQQAVQEALVSRGQTIGNQTAQTALQAAYTKNLRDVVSSVPPGPNQGQQVISAIGKGVQMGLYPADLAASFVGGQSLNDGTTMADLVKQAAIASGSPSAQSAQFGDVANIDTGPTIQPTAINRVARTAAPVGTPIAKGLTPEAASAPVEIYGDTQHPRVLIPRSEFAGAGTPSSGAPAGASVSLPGGGKGFAAAPPLGAEQGANDQAHQGQVMAAEWTKAGDEAPTQRAALQQFERLLPQFASGPAATYTKQLGALAAQFGLAPPSIAKGAAAQEEASKLAFQIAQSQFRALGGTGTNMQLESVMHTSPSEFMTRIGNANVIALLKGNADAQQVKAREWQAWQAARGPQSAQEFAAYFNQHFDPLVFQSQYLSQPQLKELVNSMDNAEKGRFRQRYNEAVANGWIPHPGAQ